MVKKSKKKEEKNTDSIKKAVTLVLLLFVVVSVIALVGKSMNKPTVKTVDAKPTAVTQQTESKVIAYYFHGTHRCWSCNTIEAYSRETIENNFKKQLEEGKLEFISLNVEQEENRQLLQKYKIPSKMLVLVLIKNGEEIEYEPMQDVWRLLRDKPAFLDYVKKGISKYLDEV